MIFYDRLQKVTHQNPFKRCVVTPYKTTTYLDMLRMVDEYIESFSIIRNSRFSTLNEVEPDKFIAMMIASLEAGYRILPIPPTMSEFSQTKMYKEIAAAQLPIAQHGDLLHFTSGSYGAQKVVVRPIENLESEAVDIVEHLGLTRLSRILITTPLAHSFACGLWRAALVAGTTLFASTGGHIIERAINTKSMMKGNQIKYMFGVPFIYKLLARSGQVPAYASLKCFAGGESLTKELVDQWKIATDLDLKQEYGLGEGGIASIALPETSWESIGDALPSVMFSVDDSQSGTEGIGELMIRRPYAPTQYLFGEAPETFDDGYIRTGDLVQTDYGRHLKFVGRVKSIIVVAGLKVVPLEIENAIVALTGMDRDEVVVIGVPDPYTGEKPVAVIRSNGTVNISLLQAALRRELDNFKVPKAFVIYPGELPRTASGKIDRIRIKENITHEKV